MPVLTWLQRVGGEVKKYTWISCSNQEEKNMNQHEQQHSAKGSLTTFFKQPLGAFFLQSQIAAV